MTTTKLPYYVAIFESWTYFRYYFPPILALPNSNIRNKGRRKRFTGRKYQQYQNHR